MADDVDDILIYTGTEFQSLAALAADQVEAQLPISDADGTIKIWSAAADLYRY